MSKVSVVCPCGTEFSTSDDRLAAGRGKYCSRSCMYTYRVRPSGLTYNIVSDNPGWFNKGHVSLSGQDHPGWGGDNVRYETLHRWVRSHKSKSESCEFCDKAFPPDQLFWANKSHQYKRDLNDWLCLCKSCHWHYDYENGWGEARRQFGKRLGRRISG